jgi:hypothetical protein
MRTSPKAVVRTRNRFEKVQNTLIKFDELWNEPATPATNRSKTVFDTELKCTRISCLAINAGYEFVKLARSFGCGLLAFGPPAPASFISVPDKPSQMRTPMNRTQPLLRRTLCRSELLEMWLIFATLPETNAPCLLNSVPCCKRLYTNACS